MEIDPERDYSLALHMAASTVSLTDWLLVGVFLLLFFGVAAWAIRDG